MLFLRHRNLKMVERFHFVWTFVPDSTLILKYTRISLKVVHLWRPSPLSLFPQAQSPSVIRRAVTTQAAAFPPPPTSPVTSLPKPPSTCCCIPCPKSNRYLSLNHRPCLPENQTGCSQTFSSFCSPRHNPPVSSLALQKSSGYSLPLSLPTPPVDPTNHPCLTSLPHLMLCPRPQLQQIPSANPRAALPRKTGVETHTSPTTPKIQFRQSHPLFCSLKAAFASISSLTPSLRDHKHLLLLLFFPQFIPVAKPPKPAGIPCEHTSWTWEEKRQHTAITFSKNPVRKPKSGNETPTQQRQIQKSEPIL